MSPMILRESPSHEDTSWSFRLAIPQPKRSGMGKHVSFSPEKISFDHTLFPANRILQADDLSKFILVSFEKLRFPDQPARVSREYMIRFFKEGLILNGIQYRFYGHSNSQLRSRSCFLREARSDEELDARVYKLGDFLKISSASKRAKRIGLLFSEAKIDWILDPQWVKDIDDIVFNGENFSDGCGLISTTFAMRLSRHKKIIFHERPYTPCVYQIRYRGYKGVLMVHPQLKPEHVHFRKSQKKFTATENNTFSIVDHSQPYAFGRLNNDIVVLLASLGIDTSIFLRKQQEHHKWIQKASYDWEAAFEFLCASSRYELAGRLLLDGLESSTVQKEIRALQNSELNSIKKNDRLRVRTLLPKSRLLFGICDPYSVLKEGEVHVRITVGRKGATTLTNTDVIVVRNPCLYPGDLLKLRAVSHPSLNHLIDCLVFPTRGKRAAPSMSSGGDLDGDKFTVIWDSDLVPQKVAESYDYPALPERASTHITRQDLAKHFASYNSMTLGRVAALHQKWVRYSPKGAMSDECQELNALYSFAVDGGSVKIPERLEKIPQPLSGPSYVLDDLHQAAMEFVDTFHQTNGSSLGTQSLTQDVARSMVVRLLSSSRIAISEYENIMKAVSVAQKHDIDIKPYLLHVDFGALTIFEKYALTTLLELIPHEYPYVWNSLVRSDILQTEDLEPRNLHGPLHLQRLYTSTVQGRAAFFEYLKEAVQNYSRRVIIIKADDRFASGIFIKGPISWDDESNIDDNVLVCSFMRHSSTTSATYRRGVKGYKIYCNDNMMQLFHHQRADTFIFLTRPPERSGADIIASIALHKFSDHVKRQYGRMNRTPLVTLEIHVISNRDRVAHQAFDLRFEHVQTEENISRFDHRPQPYNPSTLIVINWDDHSPDKRLLFTESKETVERMLEEATADQLYEYLQFSIYFREESMVFRIFASLLQRLGLYHDLIFASMDNHPALAYCALKKVLSDDNRGYDIDDRANRLNLTIMHNVLRSANHLGIAALAALEKLGGYIAKLEFPSYVELLWLACHSIRSFTLAQEAFLVFHECRNTQDAQHAQSYSHKHALAVTFDRAEEANDTCPCDEGGRPRRQRIAPINAKLRRLLVPDDPASDSTIPRYLLPTRVMVHIRVDTPNQPRIHTHVRLRVASPAEHSTLSAAVVDGLIVRASRGELTIDIIQSLPPEFEQVDWKLYAAGSIATSKAMLDAIQRLAVDRLDCCRFYSVISGEETPADPAENAQTMSVGNIPGLNPSQCRAVSLASPGWITLIWGPPGTGKTTVVVQIIFRLLRNDPEARILMTASTHNAVDNVLERFVKENDKTQYLKDEKILRVSTESSRVDKALQRYTIDARLGGSMTDDPRLMQKAEKRVKEARIVFTTCTGAGLGVLRKIDFNTVLIDEASQISEPAALIPLVKGCRTAILVGDHVQLRPTVRPMGKALEYDKSLFERLYTGSSYSQLRKTMLEVQYRFPKQIATFPSSTFYEGRLQTGNPRTTELGNLACSTFPWPHVEGSICPVVFVPCSSEEDYGRSSKSNKGQVNLVSHIVILLQSKSSNFPPTSGGKQDHATSSFSLTVLTPYSRQVQLLKQTILAKVEISTIDGFQGRESDIVIFSTVRSNIDGDLGFVEDARRLNVAWTRPRVALIIVGDRRTLETNELWRGALRASHEVIIDCPEMPEV